MAPPLSGPLLCSSESDYVRWINLAAVWNGMQLLRVGMGPSRVSVREVGTMQQVVCIPNNQCSE